MTTGELIEFHKQVADSLNGIADSLRKSAEAEIKLVETLTELAKGMCMDIEDYFNADIRQEGLQEHLADVAEEREINSRINERFASISEGER
ncbi:MAG: hypothetical protein PHS93_07855 [Candidatus Omnitrophica bacterium]|nr:hypothetical protein [Candidatus Omnitrophota bacterium]